MAPGLLLWAIWNPRENLQKGRLPHLSHATKKEESRTVFTEHRRTLEPRYPFNHQRVQRTQCKCSSVCAQIHTLAVQGERARDHLQVQVSISYLRPHRWVWGRQLQGLPALQWLWYPTLAWGGKGNLGDRERLAFKELGEPQTTLAGW